MSTKKTSWRFETKLRDFGIPQMTKKGRKLDVSEAIRAVNESGSDQSVYDLARSLGSELISYFYLAYLKAFHGPNGSRVLNCPFGVLDETINDNFSAVFLGLMKACKSPDLPDSNKAIREFIKTEILKEIRANTIYERRYIEKVHVRLEDEVLEGDATMENLISYNIHASISLAAFEVPEKRRELADKVLQAAVNVIERIDPSLSIYELIEFLEKPGSARNKNFAVLMNEITKEVSAIA